jgi:NADH-quinone oxidoreductase subunit N
VFDALLNQLLTDTTHTSLRIFSPELALSAGIVLMLLARLFSVDRVLPTHWIALWATLAAFAVALIYFFDFTRGDHGPIEYFQGLLVFDRFTACFRLGLLLFLVFVITLTVLSGIPDREDAPDFYSLLLGSAIGMMIMGGANHLLMLFLGVEMTSVPSYALVGFLKGRKQSSEAALKFVVYGAGAAGVMLYGISLIAGLLGTAEMPELALKLQALYAGGQVSLADPTVRILALGIVMMLAGFAFKLSVVPFHFWTPDAFHGASAEVGGYLTVASKAAAFVLLVRTLISLVVLPHGQELNGLYLTLGIGIGVIAAITATFGNLAAYSQSNMKRLLAYSTIAHAGYMLMAVSAMVVLLSATDREASNGLLIDDRAARAVEGLLYYLAAYLFMNLGAFAITALIRNEIFSEEIEDYRGLGFQAPILAIGMGVCLFSLVGLPPLGGFVGKLFVFASLYDAGFVHPAMWAILVIGGLNTVFSLFYYVRVLKTMFLVERPAGARPVRVPTWSTAGVFVLLVTVPLLWPLGLQVQLVSRVARTAALALFP